MALLRPAGTNEGLLKYFWAGWDVRKAIQLCVRDLSIAVATSTSKPLAAWATDGYDSWTNLLSSWPISGYTCTQSNLSLGLTAKNQITNIGFTYDASGAVLTDKVTTYTGDAES